MKMSRGEILTKLKEIICSVDESVASRFPSLDEDTRILEDLGFNSIGVLFMAISVEERFMIKLDDVNIGDLHVLSDVITIIERKMA